MSYSLTQTQRFPVSLETLWEFFMIPANLQKITPPEIKFVVLSDPEEIKTMKEGLEIHYHVSPFFNIYMNWKTVIREVKEKEYFIDDQAVGPYKKWIHKHSFKTIEGGVEMKDELSYEIPYGLLGRMAHYFFIRNQVEDIFEFRKETLAKLFGELKNKNSSELRTLN